MKMRRFGVGRCVEHALSVIVAMIKFATSANPDESDRLCPLSQHEVREWARAKVKVSDS